MSAFDGVIIGAGPAGMAAACAMAETGAAVMVLDEQPAPGGQIYRNVATAPDAALKALGADYKHGLGLVRRFLASGAVYRRGAAVWQVVPGASGGAEPAEIWFSQDGRAQRVTARSVLIAGGAMERPVPLKGWTLPGVMGAGAIQVLLKSHLIPERLVLVGTGPLMLLLAAQCASLGLKPILLDTRPTGALAAALPLLARGLRGHGARYLAKGAWLMARLRLAGVKIISGVTDVVLEGDVKVSGVTYRAGGVTRHLASDLVGLHEGVIPAQQLTRSLGCAHVWDEISTCFRPVADPFGATSVPGILVAGDAGGIGGARAAEHAGRIAAGEMLRRAGRIDATARERMIEWDIREHAAHLALRPFLDRLYAPAAWLAAPADDVVVCRCEEITAGRIRAAARDGAQGPNQAKAFLRAGMGPCQGRICGPVVSQLMAAEHNTGVDAAGYYRIRPPLKPITVGALAAAGRDDHA